MDLRDILDSGFFRPRNLVPAVLALVVGVVAWFGIRPALTGGEETAAPPPPAAVAPEPPPPEPEPEPVFPFVLVAKRDISSGVLIVADLVEWVEWRDPIDLNVAVVQEAVPLEAVLGAVTLRPFAERELLAWGGLVLPGSPGFITAVLTPGRRAVSVEVDRATTLANVVYPGDFVDVILVANINAEDAAAAGPAAQSIVPNARVLAVGSTVWSRGRYGRASLTTPGAVDAVRPPEGETYTLEVTPQDAERIALAADTGRLTLAIRPILAAPGAPHRSTPVRFGEVMRPPEAPEPPRVRVIRGGADEETVELEGA